MNRARYWALMPREVQEEMLAAEILLCQYDVKCRDGEDRLCQREAVVCLLRMEN